MAGQQTDAEQNGRHAAPSDAQHTAPALAVRARPCAARPPSPVLTDAYRAAAAWNRASNGVRAGQRQVTRRSERAVNRRLSLRWFGPNTCHTLRICPLAGFSRLAGCFVSVPGRAALCRRVPLYPEIHGRIADGIRAGRTVGVTVGCFTDGHERAALGVCWLDTCRRPVAGLGLCAVVRPSRRRGAWDAAGEGVPGGGPGHGRAEMGLLSLYAGGTLVSRGATLIRGGR